MNVKLLSATVITTFFLLGCQSQTPEPTQTLVVDTTSSTQASSTSVEVSDQGTNVRTNQGGEVNMGADGIRVSVDEAGGQSSQTVATTTAAGKQVSGQDQIVIEGSSLDQTIDGEGKNVVISGSSNDIKITGNCVSLVINGASNDVEVHSVREVVVTGAANDVEYKVGEPNVANSGINNTIKKDD